MARVGVVCQSGLEFFSAMVPFWLLKYVRKYYLSCLVHKCCINKLPSLQSTAKTVTRLVFIFGAKILRSLFKDHTNVSDRFSNFSDDKRSLEDV